VFAKGRLSRALRVIVLSVCLVGVSAGAGAHTSRWQATSALIREGGSGARETQWVRVTAPALGRMGQTSALRAKRSGRPAPPAPDAPRDGRDTFLLHCSLLR
jgi:hypothetical protein